jgi:hypothetical protein
MHAVAQNRRTCKLAATSFPNRHPLCQVAVVANPTLRINKDTTEMPHIEPAPNSTSGRDAYTRDNFDELLQQQAEGIYHHPQATRLKTTQRPARNPEHTGSPETLG